MSMLGAMGSGVQTVVGTAVAYLDLDTSKFESKMSTAMSQIATIGDSSVGLGDTLQNVGSGLQTMGSQMTKTFTLPIAGAMAVATKKTMDFEESMSAVKALAKSGMSDVEAEMEQLRERALELGGSTKFTSKEVADAFQYMALAGWKTSQMLESVDDVLNLAAASDMDLARASDIVTDSVSAFGKEGLTAAQISDMMAYAQANANTTTEQLAEGFSNAAANMATAGQSASTTIAIMSKASQEFLKGAQGGTALSAMSRDMVQHMDKIEDATDAAQLSMAGYKSITGDMNDIIGKNIIYIGKWMIPLNDAKGNFRDFLDILTDVNKATAGMGTLDTTAALMDTFTSRSIKEVKILLNEDIDSIREFRNELEGSGGSAEDQAKDRLDNLAGSITYLTSALDNFLIRVGDRLAPYIRQFADWLTELTNKLIAMSDEEFDNMVKWGLWIAAVGPVLSIVGKLSSALGGIINLFKIFNGAQGIGGLAKTISGVGIGKTFGIGKFATEATTALQGVLAIIQKISGIAAVFTGLITAGKAFFDMFKDGFSWAKEAMMAFGLALAAIGAILLGAPAAVAAAVAAIVGIIATIVIVVKDNWEEIKAWWKKTKENIKKGWNDFWTKIGESLSKFFKGFGETIAKSFHEMFDWLKPSEIIKKIKEKIIQPIKDFFSGDKSFFEAGKDLLKGLFEGIMAFLSFINPFTWIKKFIFDPIVNAFKSLFGIHSPSTVMAEIGKNIIEGLFEGIKNTWQIIINFFSEAIAAFIEWFQGLWNSLKEWWVAFWEGFHEVINGIVERFREIWQGITDWFKELWSSIIEWWNNLWNSIFEILGGLIETFKEIWNGFIEFIKNKVQEVVQNIKEKIAELWQNIKETVQKIWDFVKEAIENIWNTIKTTLENIWNTIKDTLEKIWNTVKEIISKIFEHIKEKMEEIKNFIHNKIEEIKENIKRKIEEVKEAIKQKIEELRDALVEAVNRIIEKIKELIANIKATIDEFVAHIQRIVDTIKDLIHNMVEGLRSLVTKVIETIKDVVRTFIEGCVQLWEKLKENVMKVFSEVTDFFKKRWEDIKKSFEEIIEKFKDIGANIVEKIFEGIKKAWGKVEGWFSDKFGWIGGLVDKIVGGISSMKESASGFFNGGGIFGSHANGLSYVPFDGYVAELHKGERVLTKEENEAYNRGNNSGGDTFNFYNVKDDPYEYARQMKRTKKELAYT